MAMAVPKTEFIWHNGALVKWDDAKTHVITHSLHYGAGVFEGIRCYDTSRGPAIFRLKEHFDRLYYSAKALEMQMPYPQGTLQTASVSLISACKLRQCYIRPIAFFGYGYMGVNPANVPVDVSIACWPWGAYLSEGSIDVKIAKVMRIHPRTTVCDAKITGHYLNSIFASLELRGTRYKEALLLDHEGFVSEGPGENFFIVEGETVVTPPPGNILLGITRRTVMELAKELGLTVREERLPLERVLAADEAFFTGTAAEVTVIGSIDDKPLRRGGGGPVAEKLKQAYLDVVYGRNPKYHHYLTLVPA